MSKLLSIKQSIFLKKKTNINIFKICLYTFSDTITIFMLKENILEIIEMFAETARFLFVSIHCESVKSYISYSLWVY